MKLLALAVAATALRPRSTRLRAKRSEDDIGKQAKGFYIRPSAAIERGGGFFVPGLEGATAARKESPRRASMTTLVEERLLL